jgi:hypothetical protein
MAAKHELTADEILDLARLCARETDLDKAGIIYQDRLGQTDGGVSGIFFSGPLEDEYPAMPYEERILTMKAAIRHEIAWLSQEPPEGSPSIS